MTKVFLDTAHKNSWTITLADPENLNAMDENMAQEFQALIQEIKQSKTLPRALILTGAGRAFSAGGNLEMLLAKTELSREENHSRMLSFYHSFLSIRELGVPLIAAINGHAIGAGLVVASACDIRLASPSAKLGFTFTKLGLHPGMGATFFLPKLLGPSRSSELLLTGRIIAAELALEWGLVSKVTSDVLKDAQSLADEIALTGPEATRQLIGTLRGDPAVLEHALEREALCQSENYASMEFLEGVSATREKRPPKFD